MATPFTAYLPLSQATGDLVTGSGVANVTRGTNGSVSRKIGTTAGNLWVELVPLGTATITSNASEQAPTGNGWLYDVNTFFAQHFVTGNNTPTLTVFSNAAGGSLIINAHCRAYRRTTAGVYTLINEWTQSAVTVGTTDTTIAFSAANLGIITFASNEQLYLDCMVQITTNTIGSSLTAISLSGSTSAGAGTTKLQLVMQPYQPIESIGGFGLVANGTGVASFKNLMVKQFPDPALDLTPVGRAGSTFVDFDLTLPTNTTGTVKLSIDGLTWIDVTAQDGGPIPGIFTTPPPTSDLFSVDTSANYTSTSRTGGATATVTFDTANSRLTMTGGTTAIYLSQLISQADIDLFGDLDRADMGGLVWRFVDASNFYLLTIADASSSNSTPNTITLYKIASNIATQLATASIAFTRGKYKRFRVLMLGGVITVSFDGTQLISYTDSSPLAAGNVGLYN